MVWFRLDIGRTRQADPKWLIPVICTRGGITKAEIGIIRVGSHETRFQIAAHVADQFDVTAAKVPTEHADRTVRSVRISRSSEPPPREPRDHERPAFAPRAPRTVRPHR